MVGRNLAASRPGEEATHDDEESDADDDDDNFEPHVNFRSDASNIS